MGVGPSHPCVPAFRSQHLLVEMGLFALTSWFPKTAHVTSVFNVSPNRQHGDFQCEVGIQGDSLIASL
jgi:hypothetical protein